MSHATYDVAVVGCGLIGSAAVKYLARSGLRVAAVAAPSPEIGKNHVVYSSHDDAARVQRILDPRPAWLAMNHASAMRYPQIQADTGIHFHFPVGCIYATTYQDDPLLTSSSYVAQQLCITLLSLDSFTSFVTLPPSRGFVESAPAGYISPQHLIKAQLAKTTATIFPSTAISIAHSDRYKVSLANGDLIHATKILVAAGAFSNCNSLLPRRLRLTLKGETVLIVQLSPSEANKCRNMPSGLLEIATMDYEGVYWTPPAPYDISNSTHHCIKLGCNLPSDPYFSSLQDIQTWFRTGDSDQHIPVLRSLFHSLFPQISVERMWTKRCVLTRTPTGYQYIGRIDDQFYVATGGNGYSAMCSDELGRMAAHTVIYNGDLPPEYDQALFAPQYEE